MSKTKEDLIQFRLDKANEALELAKFALTNQYWNSAASELYYVCFYLVLALFAKNEIDTYTHQGVNTKFGLHFIKEGKVEAKWGKLVKELFDKRQKGDYMDFVFLSEEEIAPLLPEVEQFKIVINQMLKD